MPGGWKTSHKASLVNNTCVFGSMPGLLAQTGTRRLEFKSGGLDMSNPMGKAQYTDKPCSKAIQALKDNNLWHHNKMTGGVGKVPGFMFRSQLRW